MDMTPQQYQAYVKAKAQPSPLGYNLLRAFFTGGLICTLGQLLISAYTQWGLEAEIASSMASVTLMALSALLTGFNLYSRIGRFGGAGSLVPITGFANAVVSAGLDFKSEGWVTGLGTKLFAVAGPVLVYGTLASVVYGVALMVNG